MWRGNEETAWAASSSSSRSSSSSSSNKSQLFLGYRRETNTRRGVRRPPAWVAASALPPPGPDGARAPAVGGEGCR